MYDNDRDHKHSYHVYGKSGWMDLEPENMQIAGKEAKLMVVRGDKLLLLEPDVATRILQTGEHVEYVRCLTSKREETMYVQKVTKRKKQNNYICERLEPLLQELNSHMRSLTSLLMHQCMKNSSSSTNEKNKIYESTEDGIPTVVENLPTTSPKKTVSSSQVSQYRDTTPESIKNGKKRIIEVSPKTMQVISNFSRKHLDFINYKGQRSVSPNKFDKDDDYCRLFLYRLNPLVLVKRSKLIQILFAKGHLKETDGQNLPLSNFAATLGLVGVEKKQFMSDILAQRRKGQVESQVYRESSEEYATDSSSAVTSEPRKINFNEKKITPSNNTTPQKVSKKRKSSRSDSSISMRYDSSSDSESSAVSVKNRKKPSRDNKENFKKLKVDNYKTESSKQVMKPKKVKATVEVHSKKVLRSPNVSVPKMQLKEASDVVSPATRARRKHLECVVSEAMETSDGEHRVEQTPGRNSSGYNYVKNRVYSMQEDRIILDHVLMGNNSQLVKGTLMWKELQRSFYSKANQARTWQSLKNRYLKYILPNLQYYGLPYDKERLLRSAAYTGDIKKKTVKENSIFKVQPVVSASNVIRMKRLKESNTQDDDSQPSTSKMAHSPNSREKKPERSGSGSGSKSGRLPTSSTPKKSPRRATPTYSEVTRKFQKRAPYLDSSDADSSPRRSAGKRGVRKLYSEKVIP